MDASSARPAPPSAITSGYNVAQVWERHAPLSDPQQEAVDEIAARCSRWPLIGAEESGGSPGESSSGRVAAESEGLGRQVSLDAKFTNSEEFYKWFSEVEAMYLSETERKFKEYAAGLGDHSQALAVVLRQVEEALTQFDQLKIEQYRVRTKTQSIQNTCERLSREREQLEEFANAVKSKLDFFDELHRLGKELSADGKHKSAEEVIDSLGRIDECIAYLSSNTQYADAGSYLTKFRSLQSKALSAVKLYVSQAFSRATEEVKKAQIEGKAAEGSQATAVETTLLYVQFKASVPDLAKVVEAIQSRLSRQDYSRLMHDMQAQYAEKRLDMLSDVVEDRLVQYQGSNPGLVSLLRLSCAYLIQVTQMEHQLFDSFFPLADLDALAQIVGPLCTILYDIVRPSLVSMYEIGDLCEIANILKLEVLGEFDAKGEALASLRPTVELILADVQGRLIYSLQQFIRDEIAMYAPTPEELAYPAVLERAGGAEAKPDQPNAQAEGEGQGDGGNGGDGGDGKAQAEAHAGSGAEASEGSSEDLRDLYAPVQNSLHCLTKTYGCLATKTFGGLAQEIIQCCTDACISGSQEIARGAGLLDSQLFLIKNLLALREQLGMFDVDLGTDELELDFTHMREHMRRILRGESSLFAVGASNAVFQLMSSARPRIQKMRVDSKKELEKRLKAACESFIMAVTKLTVEPMLSFITKVTTTRVANTKKQLKDHAFATPSKLVEIVTAVNGAMGADLPEAIRKMKLYLKSPGTQSVLFKPIKSNIAEAHGQIAGLLETEYGAETMEMVPLTAPPALMAMLDAL